MMNNDINFIARGAAIVGNVSLGKNISVWYNAVIRADEGFVQIGDNTNIQDNCTVHAERCHPVKIGRGVTIGHNAVIHGCTIGDDCLIGMGAIVMNGAVVENSCIVGAGSLVTGGSIFPEGSLVVGSPAKIIRQITEDEQAMIRHSAEEYMKFSDMAREGNK